MLRILHAPTTVGGNPQGLSKAEKELGYDSKTLTLVQNYLSYPADIVVLNNDRLSVMNEVKTWRAFWRSIRQCDVLHFNFGRTFSPVRAYPQTNSYAKWKIWFYSDVYGKFFEFLDMKIAKWLGRKIVITYQGDDARQGDYLRKHYPINIAQDLPEGYYSRSSDIFKRKRIQTADRYADIIYALNPDLLNVLPERAQFLPYASVDMNNWQPLPCPSVSEIVHIVHAPSHRLVKGTQYILDAFERLKAENIPFRYTLVENMSNKEAKKIYESADLLIDQLLAGYYGGLAVELMALAKPVICYIREEDMRYLPKGMRDDMPIINATPQDIYDVLKQYLTQDKDKLRDIGIRGRQYVEKWHDPIKIAKRVTADYERISLGKDRS